MRRAAAAIIVAALVWTACSVAGPVRSELIEPGQDFSLRPGELVQLRGDSLHVGFAGVAADSRCPRGEQCVWAGDATVRIWLQRGAGPRQARELRAAAGAGQTARALDHEVRLVRLEPHPVAGKALARQDYVATLRLTRAAATADTPDR